VFGALAVLAAAQTDEPHTRLTHTVGVLAPIAAAFYDLGAGSVPLRAVVN